MMLQFIYSSWIKGVGIFAGGILIKMHVHHKKICTSFFQKNIAPMGTGLLVVENLPQVLNFTAYTVWIDYLASRGWIDDPINLSHNHLGAFIYHGKFDQIVPFYFSRINAAELRHYGVKR